MSMNATNPSSAAVRIAQKRLQRGAGTTIAQSASGSAGNPVNRPLNFDGDSVTFPTINIGRYAELADGAINRLDTNGNGTVSEGEYITAYFRSGLGGDVAARAVFRFIDGNRDGAINREEMIRGFAQADSNRDGDISSAELDAFRTAAARQFSNGGVPLPNPAPVDDFIPVPDTRPIIGGPAPISPQPPVQPSPPPAGPVPFAVGVQIRDFKAGGPRFIGSVTDSLSSSRQLDRRTIGIRMSIAQSANNPAGVSFYQKLNEQFSNIDTNFNGILDIPELQALAARSGDRNLIQLDDFSNLPARGSLPPDQFIVRFRQEGRGGSTSFDFGEEGGFSISNPVTREALGNTADFFAQRGDARKALFFRTLRDNFPDANRDGRLSLDELNNLAARSGFRDAIEVGDFRRPVSVGDPRNIPI